LNPVFLFLIASLLGATWIDVPFTRQEKEGCGAASVWMLMEYWGKTPQPPEEIHELLYSREAHGVFASDIERYLSEHGLQTVSFAGEWDDLVRNVLQGHPLLVAIEVNSRGAPQHYVVVAGIDEVRQLVLINDPAQRKLLPMARSDFERRWNAMKRWTLLAVPEVIAEPAPPAQPAELPSIADDPLLERATTAFRAGDLSLAKRLLRKQPAIKRALDAPNVALRNEFLATIYFIEDNLDAALNYWNRNGSPQLRDVRMDFDTRWDPILLDRTIGIARATTFREADYHLARKRLDATESFSRFTFDLNPVASSTRGEFDLSLRAAERSTWGRWTPLSWLRGLPYQTISPEFRNIRGRATNVEALVRWDANKRRIRVTGSGPASGTSRYEVGLDVRDEIWTVGGSPALVQRKDFFAGLRGIPSSRLTWFSGALIVQRPSGVSVRYDGSTQYELLHFPERRLTLTSELRAQFGRTLTTSQRIERAELGFDLEWMPQARGDDYRVSTKAHAGRVWGSPTIDDLFSIGIDRDTNLWLRGHSAIVDGRKGAGPMGRRYVLWNTEISKDLFDLAFLKAKVVPFADIAYLGSLFVDPGIELRFSLASVVTFSISAGRDLKAGRTVVFTNLLRSGF
jgi:predicted double-glycine peptidase